NVPHARRYATGRRTFPTIAVRSGSRGRAAGRAVPAGPPPPPPPRPVFPPPPPRARDGLNSPPPRPSYNKSQRALPPRPPPPPRPASLPPPAPPGRPARPRRSPSPEVPAVRLAACLAVTSLAVLAPAALADDRGIDFFEKKVRPVLVEHCYKCHSKEHKKDRG